MSFIYPLGLLGLIGIPILIIIYIIKNKHTEQIISSTYLWTLSEKFLNKKRQIRLISGIISLALQIIAVATISLLVAHPVISIPNAAKEYCFIVDGSGSMAMNIDEKTKMEIGLGKVEEIIRQFTGAGSEMTLDLFNEWKEQALFITIDRGIKEAVSWDKLLKTLADRLPAHLAFKCSLAYSNGSFSAEGYTYADLASFSHEEISKFIVPIEEVM